MVLQRKASVIRLSGVVICVILSFCILMFSDRGLRFEDDFGLYYVDPAIEQVDGDLDFAAFTDVTGSDVTIEDLSTEQYSYSIINGEVLIIEGLDIFTTDLVIPETIDSYPVTAIDDFAFSYYSDMTTLTLPDTIVSIGSNAFVGCTSLKELNIPDSVRFIGDSAFSDCSSLTELVVPETVTTIEDYAFFACDSLDTITVWSTSNIDQLFDISHIRKVIIGDGALSVNANAFEYCIALESVQLPDSLTSIKECAFIGCKNLKDINFPKELLSIGESAFEDCSSLESAIMPDKVALISNFAFYNCTSLKYVELPDNIAKLGNDVFGYCELLQIKAGTGTVGETYATLYGIPFTN